MTTEPLPSYYEGFRWRYEDVLPLRDAVMNWRSVLTVSDIGVFQIKRITSELFEVVEQLLPEWTEVIAHGEALTEQVAALRVRVAQLESELAELHDEQGRLKPRVVERWAHCECESEDYGLAMIVRQVHDDGHDEPWQICANQACRAASGIVA